MSIDTKYRGPIYEPLNPLNKPLHDTLKKHQTSMDGSSFYDDLIDVYENQELDYQLERSKKSQEPKNIDKDGDFIETV